MTDKLNYAVTEVSPGVWAINEFDMDYIYVVEGRERSLIIDTGTGTGDLRGLIEKLTPLPYDVVCTHGHVDHCGGIGQFSQVYMHPADVPAIQLGDGLDGTISVFNRRRYAKLGLALHDPAQLPFDLDTFRPVDTRNIRFLPLQEGDAFELGGRCLEVFAIPAHSAGCICLLDRSGRNLFLGDAVGRIQILHLPMSHQEQFALWLKGAERILSWLPEVDRVLTGHYCPFDLSMLADQIACARQVLDGKRTEEFVRVDEYEGMMYHYGQIYFTLREENLQNRDYSRIRRRKIPAEGKNRKTGGDV